MQLQRLQHHVTAKPDLVVHREDDVNVPTGVADAMHVQLHEVDPANGHANGQTEVLEQLSRKNGGENPN